jgi:hypothetical protein
MRIWVPVLALAAAAAMSQAPSIPDAGPPGGIPPADSSLTGDVQPVEAPVAALMTGISASDAPNDAGGAVEITWQIPPDGIRPDSILITRSSGGGAPEDAAWVQAMELYYLDEGLDDGVEYSYVLTGSLGGVSGEPSAPVAATPSAQWLHSMRTGMLVITMLLTAVIFWFIEQGKRGRNLYIREIAGLSAVDDAVGRATEMGRSVLYIPGIMGMDDIQTIASMIILGRVAGKTAEYGAGLQVPVCNSVVMSVGQEIVKEAYLSAGRPDAYKRDSVFYLTDDQFGYAAGVDGIMVRQRPAAVFMLGTFYAESLILAETGKSVGAIQIAGTAMPSQLPFFIAACDYTLIGEELFAASAYLSREPKLLGSLKGQDAAKFIIILMIVIGVLTATVATWWAPAGRVADFLRFVAHVE